MLFSFSFLSTKEKGKGSREGLHRITIIITDSRIHDISNAYSGRITGADPAGVVKSEGGRTLHVAAAKGHMDVFLILLYKAGLSSIECTDNSGKTPLFLAVEKKQLDVVRLLVRGGADVQVKSCEGFNLLHCSARK